ncbi:MAG TPA: long-chain fatty acid--CoA ligase [Candidatus Eisenbacteria bacterium]|nr:long-chain fatty acid--CoA ligase [Candidatus Eisenbacteria bacterium]
MPVSPTLIGIFLDAVATHRRPDQFMRKVAGGWESISAERALADVASLGMALRELGIEPGDRVALLSENRYEWAVSDLAILGLGAVTVPIYPTLTAAQVRKLLENCEAEILIVSTAVQLEKARAACRGLACVRALVSMDAPTEGQGTPAEHGFAAVLERGATLHRAHPDAFVITARAVEASHLATIIYTSGTTGEPKGAMLTHGNIASNVEASLQVLRFESTDTYLSFLPLCHIFERMAGFYSILACGAAIAYAQSFETVGADAAEVRPTILCGVPRFFEKVMARVEAAGAAYPPLRRKMLGWGLGLGTENARAHYAQRSLPFGKRLELALADRLVMAKVRARMGGRLRFCVSGSAPLSPSVMEFFYAIGIPIVEGYGLTETSPVIAVTPFGREKPGTVGTPIPGVQVRIAPETGEILTKGPHVMRGYYRDEAATREVIRDGWFHTGDIGHLDGDGYLVITDRLKDLLCLAAGKKVAPQPIEAKLKQSRWVGEAVLIGDRRPYVISVIAPDFAALEAEAAARGWPRESRRALLDHPEVGALYQAELDRVNAELAPFEQIKRFLLLDRELSQEAGELTPTLKVKRKVVVERCAAAIDEVYARHRAVA